MLGQQILDSMESRFLNTEGILAQKLMAALQGAKVPGADTRCTAEGVSSLSAFIRVARPTDTIGNFYLDLCVPILPYGMEPIDSLQTLFDAWFETIVGVNESPADNRTFLVYPNPVNEVLSVECLVLSERCNYELTISDLMGKTVKRVSLNEMKTKIDVSGLDKGIYFVTMEKEGKSVSVRKVVKL